MYRNKLFKLPIRFAITYVFLAIVFLLLWQIGAQTSSFVRLMFSSPSLLFNYFLNNYSELIQASWITFYEALTGLLLATAFSFGIMIFCFYFPKFMDFILPVMVISQVVPLITLAPLFILLFGLGVTAKIMMSGLLCFFPIFINFANGTKQINVNIHELMFVYNASVTQKIRYVYFPLTMPSIISGLKIAATLSVIGAIVAEFNGAELGLGKNLFLAAKRLEPELMISSLFLSAIAGCIMYSIIFLIEKKVGKWYL